MSTIQWDIDVSNTPEVLRYCKKCHKKQSFLSSGLFRVNAQQNSLDIWLIYRCQKCSTTWNMEIHSRVRPYTLDQTIYEGYLRNDPELAKQCAFNRKLLQKNQVEVCFDKLQLEIIGTSIVTEALTTPVTVTLHCYYDLNIRVEKLLRQKLGLSRMILNNRIQAGEIYSEGLNLMKAKFQNNLKITLLPQSQ